MSIGIISQLILEDLGLSGPGVSLEIIECEWVAGSELT
jgi:hypothetical protein